MDESSTLLCVRHWDYRVTRYRCRRDGAAVYGPVEYRVARPAAESTPYEFNRAVAGEFNPVISNLLFNIAHTMGAVEIDRREVVAAALSADLDEAIRIALVAHNEGAPPLVRGDLDASRAATDVIENTGILRELMMRTQVRWRRSRVLDWLYGRRYPRGRTRKDRRSPLYDKNGWQSYREWARWRTQHQHARKSSAVRERMRIRQTFFIRLPIDVPYVRPYLNGIAA